MEKKEFETFELKVRTVDDVIRTSNKPGAGTGSPGEDAFDRACIDFTIG